MHSEFIAWHNSSINLYNLPKLSLQNVTMNESNYNEEKIIKYDVGSSVKITLTLIGKSQFIKKISIYGIYPTKTSGSYIFEFMLCSCGSVYNLSDFMKELDVSSGDPYKYLFKKTKDASMSIGGMKFSMRSYSAAVQFDIYYTDK